VSGAQAGGICSGMGEKRCTQHFSAKEGQKNLAGKPSWGGPHRKPRVREKDIRAILTAIWKEGKRRAELEETEGGARANKEAAREKCKKDVLKN